MKNLEESPEENASTFCLFKDYCSQTMGENQGGGRMNLNFLALLGFGGRGRKDVIEYRLCASSDD